MQPEDAAPSTREEEQATFSSSSSSVILPSASLDVLLPLLVSQGDNITTYQGSAPQLDSNAHSNQDFLLQVLPSLGVRRVRDVALLSTGSGSKEPTNAGKTFDSIVIDAGSAFLKHFRSIPQEQAAGSTHHDDQNADVEMVDDGTTKLEPTSRPPQQTEEETLDEFIRQLTRLQSLAIDALAPPLLTGVDFLAQDLLAAESETVHDGAEEGQRIVLPLSVSKLVMAGSPRPSRDQSAAQTLPSPLDRVNLCAPNEVIQISGTKGSGRKTLVLNSVLASLHANPNVHALWIGVPSLAPALSSSSSEERGTEGQLNSFEKLLQERSAMMRHHVAVKALTAWSRLQELHKVSAAEKGKARQQAAPEKDPLDRLVIETCTSIEAILALLDAIFTPSTSSAASPKVALLVIDQLHRLFFDETRLAPLDGLASSAIQAGLQKLCRQLVHYSRTKGMRVYVSPHRIFVNAIFSHTGLITRFAAHQRRHVLLTNIPQLQLWRNDKPPQLRKHIRAHDRRHALGRARQYRLPDRLDVKCRRSVHLHLHLYIYHRRRRPRRQGRREPT